MNVQAHLINCPLETEFATLKITFSDVSMAATAVRPLVGTRRTARSQKMSATTPVRQISPFSNAPSQNFLPIAQTESPQNAKAQSGIARTHQRLALDSLMLWRNMVKCQCAYQRLSTAFLSERAKCSGRKLNAAQCDVLSATCSTMLELFSTCVRTLPTPSLVPSLPPGKPSCSKPKRMNRLPYTEFIHFNLQTLLILFEDLERKLSTLVRGRILHTATVTVAKTNKFKLTTLSSAATLR